MYVCVFSKLCFRRTGPRPGVVLCHGVKVVSERLPRQAPLRGLPGCARVRSCREGPETRTDIFQCSACVQVSSV